MNGIFPDLNRRCGHLGSGAGHLICVVTLGKHFPLCRVSLPRNASGRLLNLFGVVHDGIHALPYLRHHPVERPGHGTDLVVAGNLKLNGQVRISGDLVHAVVESPQTGKHQSTQSGGGQEKHRSKDGYLNTATGQQLLLQTGIAVSHGIVHPNGSKNVSLTGLMTAKTVDALIVLHRDHGLDQCVDSPVLIAGIGLHPLTGKRFLVQRFPLLFRRVAVAEDPVQMVTANHPHVQHVFRRHHLFPKHIPVTDGAGDHHGIQPIEIGFCQSIHVFVAELFKMITL